MADSGKKNLSGSIGYSSPALILAEVCEKCAAEQLQQQELQEPEQAAAAGSMYERALALTEVALQTDWQQGDSRPSVHARAHTIRGRVLAAQWRRRGGGGGNKENQWRASQASFEAAASIANKVGYQLLELLAMRDLRDVANQSAQLEVAAAATQRLTQVGPPCNSRHCLATPLPLREDG